MTVKRTIWILFLLTLAGCGTQSTPVPSLTDEPTIMPTDEPTEEAPEASAGQVLFEGFQPEAGFACVTCHYVESDNRLLGPGLLSIEARFADYDVEAADVESYIRQSILEPRVFIAPGDPPYVGNIMPDNYGDIFTDDEIEAIVEYILSF